MWYEPLLERGWLPDSLVRLGIRQVLRARLRQERAGGPSLREERVRRLIEDRAAGPVATHTAAANEQHYEVPPAFFEAVLGRHRKYSCGLWSEGVDDLDDAEERMLELYVRRARLQDGQRILDLGCGWGSLSLYLAQRLPHARLLAVSNSGSQIETIRRRATVAGLDNVEALRADVNDLELGRGFDRVVSVEMLEHVHNVGALARRVASWLQPDGLAFFHHFAHRELIYPYRAEAAGEWVARHFFTGGMMPCADLLEWFGESLTMKDRWIVDGTHYQRTCEAWLRRMDENRESLQPLLDRAYGPGRAPALWNTWRVFFMACGELFGFRNGMEWLVVHALLEPARSDHEVSVASLGHRTGRRATVEVAGNPGSHCGRSS